MNKLVTHYRNSTQLKKEDLTYAEKEEIISTLDLLKKVESLAPEEQEHEFMTMCFNYGLDDEQARAAKEIFLGIEPSEAWERNILALERGEWVDSMETKCFKRWNKQRPSILSTIEQIFQCKIPDIVSELNQPTQSRLKDSLEIKPELISDGVFVQIAQWISDVDEAAAQLKLSSTDIPRDTSHRGRARSTPTLYKRISPPSFSSPPLVLSIPLQHIENETEGTKKKGKKDSPTTKPIEFGSSGGSPPTTPRQAQDEETERKAEIKRKKSRKNSERESMSKSQEEKEKKDATDKRRTSWVRRLSDRDLMKRKESPPKMNLNRRGSVDSLSSQTLTVHISDGCDEERKRSESDTESRRKKSTELGKRDKEAPKKEESSKVDKKEANKKDKKGVPLLCWMGSSEDLQTLGASSGEFNRIMMSRSKGSPTGDKKKERIERKGSITEEKRKETEKGKLSPKGEEKRETPRSKEIEEKRKDNEPGRSPTEEKRREIIENVAKARTVAAYQSFKM